MDDDRRVVRPVALPPWPSDGVVRRASGILYDLHWPMVWPGPPVKVVVDGRLHDWDRMGVEWRNRIAVVVTAAGAAGMTVDMGAVVPPSDLLLHPDLSAVSWLMGGVRLAPAGARVLSWSFDGRSGLMRVSSDGSRWRVREGAGLVADRVSPCSAICRLTGEEDLRPL